MTTRPDLAAIKARAETATEGPWQYDGVPRHEDVEYGHVVTGGIPGSMSEYQICWVGQFLNVRAPEDAAFIAHARADVPALVAEVERLRAAVLAEHWLTRDQWGGRLRDVCGRCTYGDGVPFLWPCPTRRAVTGEPEPDPRSAPATSDAGSITPQPTSPRTSSNPRRTDMTNQINTTVDTDGAMSRPAEPTAAEIEAAAQALSRRAYGVAAREDAQTVLAAALPLVEARLREQANRIADGLEAENTELRRRIDTALGVLREAHSHYSAPDGCDYCQALGILGGGT